MYNKRLHIILFITLLFITTSVNAGNPNSLEKTVDVEWVDENKKSYNVVPSAVQNALKELSNYVNKLGSVLEKLDNTGKLEFNISFQGEEYLDELIAAIGQLLEGI